MEQSRDARNALSRALQSRDIEQLREAIGLASTTPPGVRTPLQDDVVRAKAALGTEEINERSMRNLREAVENCSRTMNFYAHDEEDQSAS